MAKKKQYALVTGGTSGIGYELAKLLAADKYNLILVARTDADLHRVAQELREAHGVDVKTIVKDLFYPGNGPWQAVYHGTKAFVHSFTEAIRSEVSQTAVSITSLLPGATATDFFHKADMLDAKNVREGDLADPAKVARDGYDAMMNGKDMVVSGFKNKMQLAMSNVLPDSTVANQVKSQQAPEEQ
jgi:short-subunit dehydrogenase